MSIVLTLANVTVETFAGEVSLIVIGAVGGAIGATIGGLLGALTKDANITGIGAIIGGIMGFLVAIQL